MEIEEQGPVAYLEDTDPTNLGEFIHSLSLFLYEMSFDNNLQKFVQSKLLLENVPGEKINSHFI